MKRSLINKEIRNAIAACEKMSFCLPDYAYWSPEKWENLEMDRMKKTMLGWDVTDYGTGNFDQVGAVLFTLRNGSANGQLIGTPFCEKVIIIKAGQKLPMHFHFSKTEDIINRNGGILHIRVFASRKINGSYKPDINESVTIYRDGIKCTVPAGSVLDITKGNSVTITPFIYHEFFADKDGETLIVGEVSTINDDTIDNCFYPPIKFGGIEEDEPEFYHLCNGYTSQAGGLK